MCNVAGVGGFEGNFYALTAGLNYKPNANLTFRPELRYDWFDGLSRDVDPFADMERDFGRAHRLLGREQYRLDRTQTVVQLPHAALT